MDWWKVLMMKDPLFSDLTTTLQIYPFTLTTRFPHHIHLSVSLFFSKLLLIWLILILVLLLLPLLFIIELQ